MTSILDLDLDTVKMYLLNPYLLTKMKLVGQGIHSVTRYITET